MITKEDYRTFLRAVYFSKHHFEYQISNTYFEGDDPELIGEIIRRFDNIDDANRLSDIIKNYNKIITLSFIKLNFDEELCEILLSKNNILRLQELQIEFSADYSYDSLTSSLRMKGNVGILMPISFVLELLFTGDIERVKPSTDNLMNFETMFNNE